MPIETWATVRVEDTGDGLIIHPDDAKKWRLITDHQYSGHFLPDGRYRIALTHAPEQTAAADTGLVEWLTAERNRANQVITEVSANLTARITASEQREAAAREQIAALERQCDCKQIDALANSVGMKFVSWKAKAEAVEASLSSAQETIRTEQTTIANYLRDVASHYTLHSDGSNTFVIAAEWVEARAALTLARETNDGQ